MKKIAILILLITTCTITFAQGEANHWFFGQNASVDFNTTPPTTGTGKLNTFEGCSSFSDSSGNLLFYSDGSTIWDKNNAIMPNGTNLKGHPSSTQSAIIVPKPNNANLYYLFTVGAIINNVGEFGFYYYTIDMSTNNGKGSVINGPIDLGGAYNPDWSEKVTSVQGEDCNTFWVISLVYDTFYAYKVDPTGVASTPVISRVNYNSTNTSRRGYLKVSPDGSKIAAATYAYYGGTKNGKLHLYNFDNTTGIVQDDALTLITNTTQDGEPYGLEFSPNSTFLYTSTKTSYQNKLFQFDLKAQDVPASKTLIHKQTGYRGALQLAPNGKIYVTVPQSYTDGARYLNIIHNPEEKGSACNYEINGLDLYPNYAMQGLPPFIASLLLPIKITDPLDNSVNLNNTTKTICLGEDLNISSEIIAGNPTYTWSFKGQLYSTGQTLSIQNISLSDTGLYELVVETIDKCGFKKTYKGNVTLNIHPSPVAINTSYEQCDFDNNPLDGKTVFNLSLKENEITNSDSNLTVYFYESQTDYDTDSFLSNKTTYTNTTGFSQLLITKIVDNTTGCESQNSLQLIISPTSLENYDSVYFCENDLNEADTVLTESKGSGLGTFNFDTKLNEITALFVPIAVEVKIFSSLSDAQSMANPIDGNKEITTHTYYVRVTNKTTKACMAVGSFETILNYLPSINFLQKERMLCLNNPVDSSQNNNTLLKVQFGKPIDEFQWYKDDVLIPGANKSNYQATAKGFYFVEAKNYNINDPLTNMDDTYCIGYSSISVNVSNPALIEDSNLSIVDDSPNNTLEIIDPSFLGLGDYEYSLDDTSFIDAFQDDTKFNYITPGFHTLYIRDKNGCGLSSKKFAILAYPKFFTPNNDGVNDEWKLIGLDHTKYRSTTVQIFDRYGKLIKVINLQGDTWDGSYNGTFLKSDDYWFIVKLIDLNGVSIIKKGHFSLIRG
ncbi:MAG: T9SS type B sorting domain-containing protein [Flavobacteriaceae bacterium]|nr:T9SS type B sorting domain-containing protein [Flavobacteriaceae bacterium]